MNKHKHMSRICINSITMKYFKLDEVIVTLKKENLTIHQFQTLEPCVNPSLFKYLVDAKQLITENYHIWDTVKKYTNTYEFIHTPYGYKNYVSKLKPLSRAYYKMVEIMDTFKLLDSYAYKNIQSFHLAEGPGGFIEALLHKRNNSNDSYYGMTLVNDDEHTPGWKKSQTFLERNPNVTIEYGADNTGNLMHVENYNYCNEKYRHSMDIITGDGGFDFSVDYNKQEESAINLIFSQIIYAVTMQKKGGCFILKIFDVFKIPTVQMIFLLNILYHNVYICKPHTSRCANSEKYIVCTDFKNELSDSLVERFRDILHLLQKNEDVTSKLFFFLNVPMHNEFIKSIQLINAILGQQQIENINKTIYYIKHSSNKEKMYADKMINVKKCVNWCMKHDIPYNAIVKKNIFTTLEES